MSRSKVPMSLGETMILNSLGAHTRAHVLLLLAHVPGLTLSSGRRTPGRNRAVGGSPSSYHLTGRAADFVGHPASLHRGAATARAQRLSPRCTGPEEVLLHDVGSGFHLHVAW